MDKYTLIGSHLWYNTAKLHISKEAGTFNSMCGKNLGFSYCIVSQSGSMDDTDKLFTISEIKEIKGMCKICLKSLGL